MLESSKAKFTGKIRAISPKEFSDLGLSNASMMNEVKSLMPSGFDYKKNLDILPVVFSLALVNKFNANGDGIDSKTAISAIKRFKNKPINIEHKKNKIVGHIVNASFSDNQLDFSENDIESFAERKDPFYITAAAVIYKHVYPELAEAIEKASDQEDPEYQSISTSWELGFKDYKVMLGSSRMDESEIIEGEDMIKEHSKFMKCAGGSGLTEKGIPVNRLIVGEIYPLGAALTTNPAAEVSGVYLLEDEEDDSTENELEEQNEEDTQDTLKNKNLADIEKNSLIAKKIVMIKNFKNTLNMNDTQFDKFLQKLEESVASVTSEESHAKSIGLFLKDALLEQAESWKSQVQIEKESREQIAKQFEEMKASFETSQKELNEIKDELASKAASELFNVRMNFLDNKFSFSEKELEFVVAEVKDVDQSEASFEAYDNKISVLFSHKLKKTIEDQENEIKNRIELEVSKRLISSNASKNLGDEEEQDLDKDELDIEVDEKAIVNNNAEASQKTSLIQKLKENFSFEIKH